MQGFELELYKSVMERVATILKQDNLSAEVKIDLIEIAMSEIDALKDG